LGQVINIRALLRGVHESLSELHRCAVLLTFVCDTPSARGTSNAGPSPWTMYDPPSNPYTRTSQWGRGLISSIYLLVTTSSHRPSRKFLSTPFSTLTLLCITPQ